jgi:hypothetical protein
MPVPPQEEVRAVLDPTRDVVLDVILGAWRDWRDSPQSGTWRCKRSRASFVWEQMIDRAHRAFDGNGRVRILDGHETFKFLVDGRVLFRFKKADEVGLSANIPTQLALAFHDHDQNLFGLPDVYRIEIVYQLNQLETDVVDILVVARDEDWIVWTYSLLNRDDAVIPLPIAEPPAQPRPAARLIRPRASDSDEASADKTNRD